jgi:hypothetical protein
MDLSANHLFASLPNLSGQLQMTYLNMSCNIFNGSIPDSFKMLPSIATLDLSSNHLSGNIPRFFANFTYLTSLNLSYSNLQGQIPEGGVFTNITRQSLLGNSGLCGASHLGFSPCPGDFYSAHAHILKFILPVTAALSHSYMFVLIDQKENNKAKGCNRFYQDGTCCSP